MQGWLQNEFHRVGCYLKNERIWVNVFSLILVSLMRQVPIECDIKITMNGPFLGLQPPPRMDYSLQC